MNKLRLIFSVLLAGVASVLALITAVVMAGCEVEPVEDFSVSVSPQTVQLQKDQSQEFVASGATRYTWSIDSSSASETNNPWGILSSTTGEKVTYKSLRSPTGGEEFVLRYLTVTGTLGTEGASNSSVATASATVLIYHMP